VWPTQACVWAARLAFLSSPDIVIAGHDLVIGNSRQGATPRAHKTIQTQTLTVPKTDSIKRGLVKHFVDFIAKKGKATVAELQAEFTGTQFNGNKVTNDRVVRDETLLARRRVFSPWKTL
jgi:hypothetical protein